MRRVLLLVLLGLTSCRTSLHLAYEKGQVTDTGGGAIACEDETASRIGAAVLAEGGNAVDAAVATAFALGVTFPQAGGPGGGGFAVVSTPGEPPDALDFRETAPAAATADMFLDEDGKPVRARSIRHRLGAGVPGTVAGLRELHRRLGSLPWPRLVAPAVALARDGFEIPAGLARALNDHADVFRRDPAAAAIFVRADRPWQAGDLLVQPDLAHTLDAIRDRGAAGFYQGPVAELLVGDMSKNGGLVTREDLAAYRPVWRLPDRFRIGDDEVFTMPLPSSGGVVLAQIVGLLERTGAFDRPPGSSARLHLFAEASRRAFADRNAQLGDPAGMPHGLVAKLTDPDRLDRRAASIRRDRATPSCATDAGRDGSDSTTNLCVVDAAGGAVALTFTLNSTFGTHLVARGTGVTWNNEMDDFAAAPGRPNQFGLRQGTANGIVPGRRPLSSMAPTLVRRDGEVVLVLGSPGGPRILSAVAQVLVGHVVDGLPLEIAVLAPRIHHQHLPDRIDRERARVEWPDSGKWSTLLLTPEKSAALRKKGHVVKDRTAPIGRVTAIAVDPETGRRTAVVDARTYGRPATTED